MKKRIFLLSLICALTTQAYSQNFFIPVIDSLKNLVSAQLVRKYDKELSGDTLANVGGNPVKILSRKTTSPFNPVAAQYIYEKFVSFGLNTRYQANNSTCINVVATKTGTKYPNKQFLIFAHYDNYSRNSVDTIPGADDNASGICGVLEAARILANYPTNYTIKFIAFDEEEDWMIGSYAYADSAYARGDSIMAIINLDMIGFDPLNTGRYRVNTNNISVHLSSCYMNLCEIYHLNLIPYELLSETTASDNLPFWEKGYKGLFLIEHNFNTYYHTLSETFDKLNLGFMTNNIKAALISLVAWDRDFMLSVRHTPVPTYTDTSSKTLAYHIESTEPTGTGSNAARVYYRINTGNFTVLEPFYSGNDTVKFLIPGQPPPTRIYYYFALQDEAGISSVTYPIGGSGLNPPGTIPPPDFNYYEVISSVNSCSITLPKPIHDNSMTSDSIVLNYPGYILKSSLNLTLYHANDGDLLIQLLNSNTGVITLSNRNGEGGRNYFYTTFDPDASVSITQGTPPFTGTYKPQGSMSEMNNKPVAGTWVLRVLDLAGGNTGTLSYWCISFMIKTSVSATGNEIPLSFRLSQNYPNPFNGSTRISYSIPKDGDVSLKIYDLLGREVRTLASGRQNAGDYIVMFSAGDLASGVYFYMLKAGENTQIKKMVVIK